MGNGELTLVLRSAISASLSCERDGTEYQPHIAQDSLNCRRHQHIHTHTFTAAASESLSLSPASLPASISPDILCRSS